MTSINIKNPIFTYHAQLINILDFDPEKLIIEKVCFFDYELEHIYYIKYNNDPFYLVIDNLKGCFKFPEEQELELEFIIKDQKQARIYNRVWDKIKKLINNVDDDANFEFSDHNVIKFNTKDNLPLNDIVSICSMTIVIRSIYENCFDKFCSQIYLINCTYNYK